MTEKDLKKYSLLAEIATDYYERGLDQSAIANRLFLSRTRVSRLLKEAEEKGIVDIKVTINYPYERHYELEERLKTRYSLKDVLVLNNRNREKANRQNDVGQLAANYIMKQIKKDMVIGTSWGTTLANTIRQLPECSAPVQVVQLMGAVTCNSPVHTPQGIVSGIASILHCAGSFLNMPLYIEEDYVRTSLCQEANNHKILNLGMFSDIVLTSVSDLQSITDKNFWLGYMTPEMYREICEKGAVGAMFARFYDENGKEIDCAWNRKCVSISFRHILNIPNVICIATGIQKASAIFGAIRGGLIDTLITDGTTASNLLGLGKLMD